MKKTTEGKAKPRTQQDKITENPIPPVPSHIAIPPDLIEKMLFEYPRELVASIAVQLLKDDDNFEVAANRAIELLIACDLAQLKQSQGRADWIAREAAIHELPPILRFERAIKLITGVRDAPDAMKAYRGFVSATLWASEELRNPQSRVTLAARDDPPYFTRDDLTPTDEELNAFLDQQKANDIPSDLAVFWKKRFAVYSKAKKSRDAKVKGSKGGRPKKKTSDDSESS